MINQIQVNIDNPAGAYYNDMRDDIVADIRQAGRDNDDPVGVVRDPDVLRYIVNDYFMRHYGQAERSEIRNKYYDTGLS